MKRFACTKCGNEVHFDNTNCVNCGQRLGFVPGSNAMAVLAPTLDGWSPVAEYLSGLTLCANAEHNGCNWLVGAGDESALCISCRHTRMIPDLSVDGNHDHWMKLEAAKRHLFYSLIRFDLPIPPAVLAEAGRLTFDFLDDNVAPDGSVAPVLTGHDNGLITINIAEADDAEREQRRSAMGEPYRTLIGHLRHEVGHYYWDRLVGDGGPVEAYRAVFGDERVDYGEALQAYYGDGPPPNWPLTHVSAYATAHAWEDFAESWAHYFHIVDGLETAFAYGFTDGSAERRGAGFDPYESPSAEELVETWVPLTVAVNSLNRSLGQPDFYPFVLSERVTQKLGFIHQLIHGQARS